MYYEMLAYKQQIKSILTSLVLIDTSNNEIDYTIYVAAPILYNNAFWQRIFNPQLFGFMIQDKFIFEYDSTEHSLSVIKKFIDILHDKDSYSDEKTNIHEDIEIAFLLRDYEYISEFKYWCALKYLEIKEDEPIPDEQNYGTWLEKHINYCRYSEIGLKHPFFEWNYVITLPNYNGSIRNYIIFDGYAIEEDPDYKSLKDLRYYALNEYKFYNLHSLNGQKVHISNIKIFPYIMEHYKIYNTIKEFKNDYRYSIEHKDSLEY